jgi:hypothetical protein
VGEISTAAGPDGGAALGGEGSGSPPRASPSQPLTALTEALTALTDSRQRSQPPGAGTERYRTLGTRVRFRERSVGRTRVATASLPSPPSGDQWPG